MNTHTFGNHSVTCPICQGTGSLKSVKICNGLFTCPSCQERLVVTWSGHYVRDPFNGKQLMITHHLLRRQSRPWARILRDFGFVKRPAAIIALGSTIIFGISVIALESLNSKHQPFQELLEQVTDIVDSPPNSP